MAQRRMFSKEITESDMFLDMPISAQGLYFHLGMQADDDGFVSPSRIMRMVGANIDDLKLLIAKEFVIPFESGVTVITHWKVNNYIQRDRYKATLYQKELENLQCIQDVYKMFTQVRLGKVREGKDIFATTKRRAPVFKQIKTEKIEEPFNSEAEMANLKKAPQRHIQFIGEYFEEKKLKFSSKQQFTIALKRHLKDAAQLAAFSDKQIGEATAIAEKEYPDYTLGTLVKILTR